MDTQHNTPPAQVGDRVTLVRMGLDPSPIAPGTQGTVLSVTRWYTGGWNLGMRWDNGRTLGLVYPEDKFTVVRNSGK